VGHVSHMEKVKKYVNICVINCSIRTQLEEGDIDGKINLKMDLK